MLKAVTSIVVQSSRGRTKLQVTSLHRGSKRLSSIPSSDASFASTTTTTVAKTSTTAAADDIMLCGSATRTLGKIVRHGRGDACVLINVGGVEFITLRSTVACNAVLADHVARAEANKELTRENAIFIDRDPKHFAFILQYLRNKVEMEHMSSSGAIPKTSRLLVTWTTQSFMPHLPKDPKLLAELYVEATYYRIDELQAALRDQSLWTRLVSMLGWTKVAGFHGNPFVRASQLLVQARVLFVTITSIAAGTVTMQNKEVWNKIQEFFGLKEHAPKQESLQQQQQQKKDDLISLLVEAVADQNDPDASPSTS